MEPSGGDPSHRLDALVVGLAGQVPLALLGVPDVDPGLVLGIEHLFDQLTLGVGVAVDLGPVILTVVDGVVVGVVGASLAGLLDLGLPALVDLLLLFVDIAVEQRVEEHALGVGVEAGELRGATLEAGGEGVAVAVAERQLVHLRARGTDDGEAVLVADEHTVATAIVGIALPAVLSELRVDVFHGPHLSFPLVYG